MRILHVLAGADHGGAETAFVDMCIAMHEAGQTVEVVTKDNPVRVPRLRAAGIKVHLLPFGGGWDVVTPFLMRRIICAFKPDIVQTWMSRASAKTPRWNASMGIPRYLTLARLGGYYKMKYFTNTDYFVAITPDIKRYLVESGVAEDRVRHINNFAETEQVIAPLKRSDYGIPEEATLLLGLGRLHPSKAFDTLIKVVARIDGVYVWIAGEGPQRAELEALIDTLGVKDRVRLLGWRSDRAALFAASDICAFVSRYEPFGTVFVQSWAQRVPLLVTKADGPRQFVRDGVDGLLIDIDDETAMEAAIRRLAADSDLARILIENGYQRYQQEFTKEKCVQAYFDLYAEKRALEKLAA